MNYNIIDIVLVALTVFLLTYSFFKGFIKRMSWSLATVGAFIISCISSKYVNDYFMFTDTSNKVIVFIILLVLLIIILKILLNFISKKLKDKAVLGTVDRLMGLIIGALQSGAIVFIISILAFYLFNNYSSNSIIVNAVADLLKLKG